MTEPAVAASVPWRRIVEQTAQVLGGHIASGLGRHVTEDVIRFALIQALVTSGVAAERMSVEARDPALPGSRLDLVIDIGTVAAQVVEIKFPRDSVGSGAADTMTLGEMLRDLYRLSLVNCQQRLAVQAVDRRLLRYLDGRSAIVGSTWPRRGETLRLSPDLARRLPRTASDQLPSGALEVSLTATCVHDTTAGPDLTVFLLEVSAAERPDSDEEATIATPQPTGANEFDPSVGRPDQLGTARTEILAEVRAREAAGAPDVGLEEIARALRAKGTAYADSTIRTMMSSWMLTPRAGERTADLERVDRGRYRTPRSSPAPTPPPVAPTSGGLLRPALDSGATLVPDDALEQAMVSHLASHSALGMKDETWRELLRTLTDRMEELARRGSAEVYSELIRGTALDGRPDWHHAISWVLGVARACHSQRLPMLTAVVYGKASNTPGPGFSDMARHLGRQRHGEDDLTFWLSELNVVHDTWRRDGTAKIG